MNLFKSIVFIAIVQILSAKTYSQEIFVAVKKNDLTSIKELIGANQQLVHAKDSTGRTPLHWACRGVHYDVLKFLVEKGADVNALDHNGIPPLTSVASRNHREAVEYLLDHGAKTEAGNNNQSSAILYAVRPEYREVLDLLVKNGASLEVRNDYQRTPLILACREGGSIVNVKILVENGANINARDRFGDTPLTLSAWRGFENVVDYLLDKNAEFSTAGGEGLTLLSYATDKRLWKLYQAMLAKGGDRFLESLLDKPLLHWAAAGGSEKIVMDLLERQKPVNVTDIYGWTPLHYASYFGRLEAGKLLIEHGADINAKTPLGESPVYLAGIENKQEIADLLISKGANREIPPSTILSGPYLGQGSPGSTPELFAPGIASRLKGGHSCITFSPDGTEAFWTEWILNDVGYSSGCTLWHSKILNGFWTMPEKILRNGDTPFFSVDGKRIYFLAALPLPPENQSTRGIWYFERTRDSLGSPKLLDFDVAGNGLYWQFSFDRDENIYFSGDNGLFRCVCKEGKYLPHENLSEAFHPDYRGMGPFVSPDGSYIIFSSMDLPGSFGSMDLYVGYRNTDGNWTKPINMGPTVNSSSQEILPMVSPDGKYLFMRSERNGVNGIYRADAKIIEELRPKDLPVLKGPHVGQTPPGNQSNVFAPDFVSTGFGELNSIFTPDGKEFHFFRRGIPGKQSMIMVTRTENGAWINPEPVDFNGNDSDIDLFITPDGRSMIFCSKFIDGMYKPAEKLPEPIKTRYREFDVFVNPDEKMILFASEKSGGSGGSDIHVSFKRTDGSWSEPMNLGNDINSAQSEYGGTISPDGKYFFYTSGRNGSEDIYWVSVKMIRIETEKLNGWK